MMGKKGAAAEADGVYPAAVVEGRMRLATEPPPSRRARVTAPPWGSVTILVCCLEPRS